MFRRLGEWAGRRPGSIIAVWAVVIGVAAWWAFTTEPVPPADVGSFLPYDNPLNQAVRLSQEAFPQQVSRSQIVVVAVRDQRVGIGDLRWLDELGRRTSSLAEGRILSPASGFLRHRLVSPDGRAAMLVYNLSSNFISQAAGRAVNQVEAAITTQPPPPGLVVEITGTAGVGRDYALATQAALHRTTWVTVVAVLGILVLIYRSPLGALVPLASIGACVFVAFVMLALAARYLGWDVSGMERIFSVVLIFGMGVDFALFWIARYREALADGPAAGDHSAPRLNDAAAEAMARTGPAIAVSALTTICGLTAMLTAELLPARNAGKVLAAVLTVALLAALTLTPALARALGRGLFWPAGLGHSATWGQRRIWPAIAALVTRRPWAVLIGGTGVLGALALWSLTIEPRFDSLSELPPNSTSMRGFELASAHFARGQLYSNNRYLKLSGAPGTSTAPAESNASPPNPTALSRAVADRLVNVRGVHDVYSLDAPLGRRGAGAAAQAGELLGQLSGAMDQAGQGGGGLGRWLKAIPGSGRVQEAGHAVSAYYLSTSPRVLRFEILIDSLPFSPEALATMDEVDRQAQAVLAANGHGQMEVRATGPTPYAAAIRAVAGRDQRTVMLLATVVIAAIVLSLVRDLPLTVFMLLATWLTYGATLTLAQWFFVGVLDGPGLDWKVRLIVFVIIVAVGQDYNIFLVSRLFQEPADLSDVEATRRAIIRTGSVISSCGVIMAATLGSLWAGQLTLLRQVGFAMALGVLIDTFFVRPLLLPSFFLATHRRRVRHRGVGLGSVPSGPFGSLQPSSDSVQ